MWLASVKANVGKRTLGIVAGHLYRAAGGWCGGGAVKDELACVFLFFLFFFLFNRSDDGVKGRGHGLMELHLNTVICLLQ